MSDLSKRVAALSPEKRDLLLRQLQAREKGQPRQASTLPTIVPDPERRALPFPLSDIQQVYWIGQSGLFDLHSRGSMIYMAYEITGISNRYKRVLQQQLDTAIQQMIDRHDMLRAIILPDGRQQILPHVPPYRVTIEDLRGRIPRWVEAELAKARERMCFQRRPLDRWPLFEILAHHLNGRRLRLHIGIDALLIDGTSRTMFLYELFQLLAPFDRSFPPVECSYRDYVLTWAAFQESELYLRARDYWLNRLSSLPPAPELPLARHIDLSTPNEAVNRSFQIEPQTWQRLKTRAAQAGLSPSGVAAAAYVEILSEWSKRPRFTIKLVGTYRPPIHPRIHDIIGNFNTIYLLAVDNALDTFEARAKRLQEQITIDLEYRYFSGFQVLRELNRRRGGSSRAVMPILFNSVIEYSHPSYRLGDGAHAEQTAQSDRLAATPRSSFGRLRDRLGGLLVEKALRLYQKIVPPPHLRELEVNLLGPQILLAPTVSETGAGALNCTWQSVEHVFPSGLMEDMVAAYMRLLQRLADDEESWRQTRRQLAPERQLEQRAALNASATPIAEELIHILFAAQVARRPLQTAVIDSDQRLTYADVDRRSNQVAARLRRLGARPNTLVAVVLEQGCEQVVAVMGILRAGAAYLPIDPQSSEVHLWRLLEQGEVQLVLTHSSVDARLEWPAHLRRLCLDQQEFAELEQRPLEPVQRPDDIACVYFTSGTTQPPRAVMLDHRGLLNTILAVNQRFDVGSEDGILALSRSSFDLSAYDIFGPLVAGGTIIMPEAATAPDPARWAELMAREKVTLWNSTPALLELLVAYLAERPEHIPQTLRLALLSRDWIPMTLPQRLKSLIAGVRVVSMGGAAEASIWSTMYPIEDVDPAWSSLLYGWPLANQRVYLLNEALEPCPVWVPGQLYIGGVGLAKGYWRDERTTHERFIRHPHTGERLYRTGDLGRFLPDGQIEFLGRDGREQATVYGYSVAPRAIEALLEQHPALRCAVVLARAADHAPGEQELVAYVVTSDKSQVTSDGGDLLVTRYSLLVTDLLGFLLEKLPDYMVPGAFVTLDALPLTPNGKVDRDALPRLQQAIARPPKAFTPPRDTWEHELTQIWEDLLDTRPVGVTDNFFDLGGNSFLAAQLMARIQQQFGQPLPLRRFFHEATIEQLAPMLQPQAGVLAPSAAGLDTGIE